HRRDCGGRGLHRGNTSQSIGEIHARHASDDDFPQGSLHFWARPQGFCREAWHRTPDWRRRAMSETVKTVDFGAPDKFGAHLFRVEIPASRNEPVLIIEDFGYRGLEGGIPRDEERVILFRTIWSGIADIARREFNDRLK